MSKERLEEIAYNVGISVDGEKALMSSDDYDFLYNYALEQTEQVQELEEFKQKAIRLYDHSHSRCKKLEKQNKRYRQQISRLKSENEELAVAYNNAQKEILTLKNELEEEL